MADAAAVSVTGAQRGRAVLEGHRAGGRAGARRPAVTVAVKVTDWPKHRGVDRGNSDRRGAVLVDDLGEARRGAGSEVSVAAVESR